MSNTNTKAPAQWKVVGIDPAPSKQTLIWSDTGPEAISAAQVPDWVANLVAEHERLLIAWDAPLSFRSSISCSDRPVDRALRAILKAEHRIDTGAASVLPFSGCSHWALSCATLGFPFGRRPGNLQLAPVDLPLNLDTPGAYLIEVHPAVTLATWWLESKTGKKMRRYKGKLFNAVISTFREVLSAQTIPDAVDNDDKLDAWVAWRMACDYLNGEAGWVGDSEKGGYVLPASVKTRKKWEMEKALVDAEEKLRGRQ